MRLTPLLERRLARLQRHSLLLGLLGLVLCLLGWGLDPAQFFRSYLVAFLFWLAVALGSLAVMMLHHMVGGAWGFALRRFLEAASRTFPLLALLFVPLLAGLHHLFEWTHQEVVASHPILQHKSPYLNVPFFLVRAALYFLIWILLAHFLNRLSRKQEQEKDAELVRRLQLLSGPGLVLFGATSTFAAVDWVMSLEPEWFSTVIGMLFMVEQALTSLAFMIPLLALVSRYAPYGRVLSSKVFHDLGNLLLAFVMLWAYLSFSQYLIIWSGNLPEEITWYLRRSQGGWQYVALALVLFSFAVPFLLLLARVNKQRPAVLARIALLVLILRWVELVWMVEPTFHPGRLSVHWLDLVVPLTLGGIWLSVFFRQLRQQSLFATADPRWQEAFGPWEAVENG